MADYLLAELDFLKENRYWKWVPYSVLYESVKYAGLYLGKIGLMVGPMARRIKQGDA